MSKTKLVESETIHDEATSSSKESDGSSNINSCNSCNENKGETFYNF